MKQNKKIVIEMACSANGYIATLDNNEDFLSNRNYQIMLEFLKEYDCLVWGRKTFENVSTWGENYIDDLKDTKVIVLSTTRQNTNKYPNVYYCSSIDKCLELCEEMNLNKILVSGGANTNNGFMNKNIVDEIIINYNPYLFNKGIPLFEGNYFERELELLEVKKETEDIVQIRYKVNNKGENYENN